MLSKFINTNKKNTRHKSINDEKLKIKRRVSRLACIQAIYMMNMNEGQNKQMNLFVDSKMNDVQSETFCRNVIYIYKNYVFKKLYQQQMVKGKYIDESFLFNTLKHVSNNGANINQKISENLNNGWKLEGIDVLLKSILQAAIAEKVMFSFIHNKIIISEYTLLTSRFFGDKQAAFINAILQKAVSDILPN